MLRKTEFKLNVSFHIDLSQFKKNGFILNPIYTKLKVSLEEIFNNCTKSNIY